MPTRGGQRPRPYAELGVMLNDRVDMSKEFMSESFLNFSLIVVNILIPAGVAVEQLYQNNKKAEEEGEYTANPLGADGAED